jgi:lipopolysaccharide export system protein LptA
MRVAASCLVLLLLSAAASTSVRALPAPKRQDCEVALDADKFADDQKTGMATASGNAVVTQCDLKLHADSISYDRKNQRVTAAGHILVISEKSGAVSGDNGVYDMPKKLITLTGNVIIKQGKNVFRGEHATYNVATDIAQIDPGTSKGRVHAVLTPPPAKDPEKQN